MAGSAHPGGRAVGRDHGRVGGEAGQDAGGTWTRAGASEREGKAFMKKCLGGRHHKVWRGGGGVGGARRRQGPGLGLCVPMTVDPRSLCPNDGGWWRRSLIRGQGGGAGLGKMPRSAWDEVSEQYPGTWGRHRQRHWEEVPGLRGGGRAGTEKGEVRSPAGWGEQEVPGHPHLSRPLPEPRPARAAQDMALEEQTRTGEPQVWLPAQKQAAGASEGPGPRRHQDIDNNTSVGIALPSTGPTNPPL